MRHATLTHEELTGSVIGAFYEVYNTLGFGFLPQIAIVSSNPPAQPRVPYRRLRQASVYTVLRMTQMVLVMRIDPRNPVFSPVIRNPFALMPGLAQRNPTITI